MLFSPCFKCVGVACFLLHLLHLWSHAPTQAFTTTHNLPQAFTSLHALSGNLKNLKNPHALTKTHEVSRIPISKAQARPANQYNQQRHACAPLLNHARTGARFASSSGTAHASAPANKITFPNNKTILATNPHSPAHRVCHVAEPILAAVDFEEF